MRVLLTSTAGVDQRLDGVTVFTHSLAGHLGAVGAEEVAVFCSDLARHPAAGELAETSVEGVRVFRAALPEARSVAEALDAPGCEQLFAGAMEEFRPDVVHLGNLELLSSKIVDTARGKGVQVVLTAHDCYLMCPAVRMLEFGSTAICPGPDEGRRCGSCLAATGHLTGRYRGPWRALRRVWDVKVRGVWREAFRRRFARLKAAVGQIDAVVCPSRYLGEAMAGAGMLEEWECIPNGSEMRMLPERPTRGEVVFGVLAHQTRAKGGMLALEAMKRLPGTGAHLEIHGDGDRRCLASMRVRAESDRRVSLEGPYRPADLPRVLRGIDVVVVPSLFPENCPLVVQDALAAGRPCIVPAGSGAAEAVKGTVHGLHYRRGDAESLSVAMGRLVADRSMLDSMRTALEEQRPVPSRSEVAGRYLEVYRRSCR